MHATIGMLLQDGACEVVDAKVIDYDELVRVESKEVVLDRVVKGGAHVALEEHDAHIAQHDSAAAVHAPAMAQPAAS